MNQLRKLGFEFKSQLDEIGYPKISKNSKQAIEFNETHKFTVVCCGNIYSVDHKIYEVCEVIPDKFLYDFLKS